MVLVTGDRYLDSLVKFVENNVESLIEGTLVLKLNPIGLHYVHSRLEALSELESLLSGAPVDYLRAYVSDLGDHRALEKLRRILRLLTSLKVVSVLPPPARDPTPLSLLPFGRLKILELRGCDLSTSAARGLLELRHTLEKLICHNSTDALRHIFASRIADIKNSPHWNKLSFISCARNGLILMDESLQLLPAVETLDLSRNKFAKVDNLRKCTKLKHLDLGFNHLRNVASFIEVSCHIVKLVLRNNALTTLRGLENLKSLQGLDISYNIISNFLELEILAGLSSLQSLWLEGNPLCYARLYRAQVFSFFANPEKRFTEESASSSNFYCSDLPIFFFHDCTLQMELDEKKICTSELWQRQIIIASRQKRPASFGFYSPARDRAKIEGSINTKRKKLSRVASIETEEQNTSICSDIESMSLDIDNQSKEENALSDEEAEIVELMNRIEKMKKERSDVWLQEFKDWINDSSDNFVGLARGKEAVSSNHRDDELKTQTREEQLGETSKYFSESMLASGDDSSTNILEADNSFAETSANINMLKYPNQIGEAASKIFLNNTGESVEITKSRHQDSFRPINNEVLLHPTTILPQSGSFSIQRCVKKISANINIPPLTDTDNILDFQSSLASTGSPPHYKEDILHRRQNLEEEFLQLSAESFSVASSDSDTSCSDDEYPELTSMSLVDQSPINNFSERTVDSRSPVHLHMDVSHEKLYPIRINCRFPASLGVEGNSNCMVVRASDASSSQGHFSTDRQGVEIEQVMMQDVNWLEKKKRRRKPARRIVSLCEENEDDKTAEAKKTDVEINGFPDGVGVEAQFTSERASCQSAMRITLDSCGRKIHAKSNPSIRGAENLIKNYFSKKAAESGVDESYQRYIICNCLLEERSQCIESEVAVTLSSEHKLHVLLLENSCDRSGSSFKLVGCHGVEQKRKIFVGLGLQIIRVCFECETTYLFVTRNIDISRELLSILASADSRAVENNFSLQSLEQAQADLFERHVCGGLKMSILQYAMVMFWCNSSKEDPWLGRSLFVLERHLLLCMEDVTLIGSLSESVSSSSYFSLDSCCPIVGVSEVVIEMTDCYCVTLTLGGVMSEFPLTLKEGKEVEDTKLVERKPVLGPQKWKLKWFSEESLFKFVALLQALHGEATTNPLVYRHSKK